MNKDQITELDLLKTLAITHSPSLNKQLVKEKFKELYRVWSGLTKGLRDQVAKGRMVEV